MPSSSYMKKLFSLQYVFFHIWFYLIIDLDLLGFVLICLHIYVFCDLHSLHPLLHLGLGFIALFDIRYLNHLGNSLLYLFGTWLLGLVLLGLWFLGLLGCGLRDVISLVLLCLVGLICQRVIGFPCIIKGKGVGMHPNLV